MAIPASQVWEIRFGGSDANGGGFDPSVSSPGTDYTLQDAAQVAYTDLVIGGTNTQLTSAGNPFTPAHVGNTLNVTGGTGFTPGWFGVRSVSGGVATMDRAVGTAASTGGTGNLGGALATPGKVGGLIVLGNAVYLKYNATPYILSSTTANVAGGVFAPSVGDYSAWTALIGYDTTRTVNNTDANRPTIQVPSSGVTSVTVVAVSGFAAFMVRNVIADGQSKSAIRGFNGSSSVGHFHRCKAINCTNGGFNVGLAVACEATGCSSAVALAAGTAVGCVAHDNTIGGFSGNSFAFCLAYGNTGAGFLSSTSTLAALACTAHNNTGSGFTGSFLRSSAFASCLATGNGAYGFDLSGSQSGTAMLVNCGTRPNSSGATNGVLSSSVQNIGLVALSADPYNNAAGGGALLRAAGYPGAFPGSSVVGYPDIGAVQHQDAGGTTTYVLNQIVNRILINSEDT